MTADQRQPEDRTMQEAAQADIAPQIQGPVSTL